jgi:hypothetical protein
MNHLEENSDVSMGQAARNYQE